MQLLTCINTLCVHTWVAATHIFQNLWGNAENSKSPLWERNKHGEVIRPKYELISSHISRRSGATNLYKLSVLSNKEMRSITGHQSEKVFESYIRVGLSEQA